MLDPKLLRDNPDAIRDALTRRGTAFDLDPLVTLEAERRSLLTTIEDARHQLKQESDAFARS